MRLQKQIHHNIRIDLFDERQEQFRHPGIEHIDYIEPVYGVYVQKKRAVGVPAKFTVYAFLKVARPGEF